MSIASDTPYQSGEDMGENETESVMGKNDRKGNVLVIGNSGVGKSTLINAVVGEQVAVTGRGTAGQTNRLEIYGEDDASPFRIIDSVGFEPAFFKRYQAIAAMKKWSEKCGGWQVRPPDQCHLVLCRRHFWQTVPAGGKEFSGC